MTQPVNQPSHTRTYHAPRRTAAAAETRREILRAAKEEFEARGWAATTIRAIAGRAAYRPRPSRRCSPPSPALLEAALLGALGGDPANTDAGSLARPEVVLELQGEARRGIEEAPDAATMLELHAALACEINARVARICWAVDTAVSSDARLAALAARLTDSWLFGVRWSAEVLLRKPGVRADLTLREAEATFQIAIDWNTYLTLTTKSDMSPEETHEWVRRYYRRMLLA